MKMCSLLKKMTFFREIACCVLMIFMISAQASEADPKLLLEALGHSEKVQRKGYSCLLSPWLERVPEGELQSMAGLNGSGKLEECRILDAYQVRRVGDDPPLDRLFGSLIVSCLRGKAGDYPELQEKNIKDGEFIHHLGEKYKKGVLKEWEEMNTSLSADEKQDLEPCRIMGFIRPRIEKIKGHYVLATGYFRSVSGMSAPVKVMRYSWYENDRLYQVTQTCLEVREAVWSVFFNQTMESFQFDKKSDF